ncbi:MAG: uroporphyrinogen-III C-methyltransferase [Arenicellales bacterium]|nr:uroporphyrinogen-III C-methyltransferase [Arenicellales bacterium]
MTQKTPTEQEDAPSQPSAEPSGMSPATGNTTDELTVGVSAGQLVPGRAGWVAPLALVLAVAGAALSAYTWYATHVAGQLQIGRELGRVDGVVREVERLVDSQAQADATVAALRRQAEDDRRDLLAKIDSAGTTLRAEIQAFTGEQATERAQHLEALESLADVVAKTRSQMGTTRDDWLLQEVAHLLLLANQRLTLIGDVALAQKALALADERLKTFAGPQILKIRRALAQEQEQLGQLHPVDVAGISLTLGSLAQGVGALPLKGDGDRPPWSGSDTPAVSEASQSTQEEGQNSAQALGRRVLNDLADLVRVRRVDQTRVPKLDTSARFLAYENLRLQLVAAQLALLRQDQGLYRENLSQARAWLVDYFAVSAPVESFDLRLTELAQVEVTQSFPDISVSLDLLRSEIQRRDSTQ